MVEDPHPNGAGWLIHSKTLQTYLSLLDSSEQEETQEACCGALQNLTAHEGIVRETDEGVAVAQWRIIPPLVLLTFTYFENIRLTYCFPG